MPAMKNRTQPDAARSLGIDEAEDGGAEVVDDIAQDAAEAMLEGPARRASAADDSAPASSSTDSGK